jgi:hypothetical protein
MYFAVGRKVESRLSIRFVFVAWHNKCAIDISHQDTQIQRLYLVLPLSRLQDRPDSRDDRLRLSVNKVDHHKTIFHFGRPAWILKRVRPHT